MKLRRVVPLSPQVSTAGYWLTADGRWRVFRYRHFTGNGGWRIRSRASHFKQAESDAKFLAGLGLDCDFRTRREALAALEAASSC